MKALTQKTIEAKLAKRSDGWREFGDAGQPGLFIGIGPKKAQWLLRYTLNGKRRKVRFADYGDTEPGLGLAAARTKAEKMMEVVLEGRDPMEEEGDVDWRTATIEQAFETFLDQYRGKRADKPVSVSTMASYRQLFETYVKPKWAGRKIRGIVRRDVMRIVDEVEKVSPSSATKLGGGLLSSAFGWMMKREIITANPYADIETPSPSAPRTRVLSESEIRWLWEAAGKAGWPGGDLVRLLLLTAARRSEVAEAPWSEFDLDAELWTISGSRTKNHVAHTLPLPATAVEILRALPRVVTKDAKESPLILSRTGEAPVSDFSKLKAKIDKAMIEAAKEDGHDEPIQQWGFHDIRRTVTTQLQELGHGATASYVLNHVSVTRSGITNSTYGHYDFMREKAAALAAWADKLAVIVGEKAPDKNVVPFAKA